MSELLEVCSIGFVLGPLKICQAQKAKGKNIKKVKKDKKEKKQKKAKKNKADEKPMAGAGDKQPKGDDEGSDDEKSESVDLKTRLKEAKREARKAY